jgi:hypothetical protein
MSNYKKKNYNKLIILLSITLLLSLLLSLYSNIIPLNCLRTLGTRTIFIYNQTEGYGVKHTDDKQELLNLLSSLNLKKTKPFNIDNLYYRIYILRNIRGTISIGFFPDGIVINGKYYSVKKASYEKLDDIYEKLDDRYPMIKVQQTIDYAE